MARVYIDHLKARKESSNDGYSLVSYIMTSCSAYEQCSFIKAGHIWVIERKVGHVIQSVCKDAHGYSEL